jgi:crossover junction endodeoxyribonuclease RuvC
MLPEVGVVADRSARYNSRTAVRVEPHDAPVRVLGVDPGLTRTGWALVVADGRRYRLLDAGVVATKASAELAARLAEAYRRFNVILEEGKPAVLAIEDIFTVPRFPSAALKMAHLRGVLCLAAALAGIEVLSLTATTVKQRLTGNGHASKEQVQRMVFELCDVAGQRIPSDLSDAVALGIAGLHQVGHGSRSLAARR